MDVLALIEEAYALLQQGITRFTYCRNKDCKPVSLESGEGYYYCSAGALFQVALRNDVEPSVCRRALQLLTGDENDLMSWHDRVTDEEVKHRWQTVINRLKEQQHERSAGEPEGLRDELQS